MGEGAQRCYDEERAATVLDSIEMIKESHGLYGFSETHFIS